MLIALARRAELAPFRVLCLAVAADYLMSLPWFLLFPVPERWAYPDSNAILLSDQWSSTLIDSIRPLSAINNSFPSTHVSLTVIVIFVCWLFHVRLRNTVTALAITVILATFVLGIHWLADIIAGVAVGALSVAIAWRFTDTSERRELALESDVPLVRRRSRTGRRLAEAGACGFRSDWARNRAPVSIDRVGGEDGQFGGEAAIVHLEHRLDHPGDVLRLQLGRVVLRLRVRPPPPKPVITSLGLIRKTRMLCLRSSARQHSVMPRSANLPP